LTKHLLDLLKQLDNKPLDYSGRGVVIPDVRQQPDTVGLPKFMVRELFTAVALRSLIKRGHAGTVSEAQELLERCPDSPEVKTAMADGIACRSVLVLTANRKLAVFRPVLVDGEAIHLHPDAASRLGLTFCGEQLMVHVPLSDSANEELGKPREQVELSSELTRLDVERLIQMTLQPVPVPLSEYDRILLGIQRLE
jgi:DNA-directed RNA polymerase subunit beta'